MKLSVIAGFLLMTCAAMGQTPAPENAPHFRYERHIGPGCGFRIMPRRGLHWYGCRKPGEHWARGRFMPPPGPMRMRMAPLPDPRFRYSYHRPDLQ